MRKVLRAGNQAENCSQFHRWYKHSRDTQITRNKPRICPKFHQRMMSRKVACKDWEETRLHCSTKTNPLRVVIKQPPTARTAPLAPKCLKPLQFKNHITFTTPRPPILWPLYPLRPPKTSRNLSVETMCFQVANLRPTFPKLKRVVLITVQ